MLNKRDIDEEISEISSLKDLTDVYGEIASIRMMKIRSYVLRNRDFIGAISDIFKDTLAQYSELESVKVRAGKLKKGSKITFLSHNGKTVSVLISSNTGFYGDVISATFNKFTDEIKGSDSEITIIGKLGRQLFLSTNPNKPYSYYELPDYGIDKQKLVEVIEHLVKYEEIKIYFGKYVTVLRQIPAISTI